MKTLKQIIADLKPGYEEVISSCNGITCSVVRSGKGDILRFVRTFANGSWEVFKTCKY